ncbi:hypothetical protein AVEN_92833-1 [Araneus ventricosus]|uniref:Uncharacterized protein n=1 Tax=Araneus ventricosus TaxID=182803 RepID=A0A4Y2IUZ8_ARAVE|nr:hypothetical protein AVEN_92833-1 [Araneus ventricosus]
MGTASAQMNCRLINDLPRRSRDNVVPTTIPVIKQTDTNEDCAKTLTVIGNKLAEDANTSFIEEKSVKGKPGRCRTLGLSKNKKGCDKVPRKETLLNFNFVRQPKKEEPVL